MQGAQHSTQHACARTSTNFILPALSPASFFMCSNTRGKELLKLSISVTVQPCSSSTRTVWLAAADATSREKIVPRSVNGYSGEKSPLPAPAQIALLPMKPTPPVTKMLRPDKSDAMSKPASIASPTGGVVVRVCEARLSSKAASCVPQRKFAKQMFTPTATLSLHETASLCPPLPSVARLAAGRTHHIHAQLHGVRRAVSVMPSAADTAFALFPMHAQNQASRTGIRRGSVLLTRGPCLMQGEQAQQIRCQLHACSLS